MRARARDGADWARAPGVRERRDMLIPRCCSVSLPSWDPDHPLTDPPCRDPEYFFSTQVQGIMFPTTAIEGVHPLKVDNREPSGRYKRRFPITRAERDETYSDEAAHILAIRCGVAATLVHCEEGTARPRSSFGWNRYGCPSPPRRSEGSHSVSPGDFPSQTNAKRVTPTATAGLQEQSFLVSFPVVPSFLLMPPPLVGP